MKQKNLTIPFLPQYAFALDCRSHEDKKTYIYSSFHWMWFRAGYKKGFHIGWRDRHAICLGAGWII